MTLINSVVLSIDKEVLNKFGFLSIVGLQNSQIVTSVEIVVFLNTVESWVLDIVVLFD